MLFIEGEGGIDANLKIFKIEHSYISMCFFEKIDKGRQLVFRTVTVEAAYRR